MATSGDMMRVVNVGDKEFKDGWDGNKFVIPPGGERFVPFDAIEVWLGHPDAMDTSENNRVRLAEYTRLRVRYGAYEFDDKWEENKPRLEVYTLEGDRVTTVVDDPEGEGITPDQQTVLENRLLSEQLARMQEQMKVLQNQINDENRGADASVQVADDDTEALQEQQSSTPTNSEPPQETIEEDKPNRVKVS